MKFEWEYEGEYPKRLRSVFKSKGVSASLIKAAIYHGGKMQIDGEDAWARDLVQPGQSAALVLPPEKPNMNVIPCDLPIAIVYEDEDYLILNKPAGVATVPAHHVTKSDSLVNRVRYYYEQQHYENLVIHVATRLDKNTSGLVVFPKHRFAHAVMDQQLKQHLVKKNYFAVVEGQMQTQHGYIDAPIDRDPELFVVRTVIPSGKPSVTEYWVEKGDQQFTLLKIRLHTGRTHQIRVHFSYLGHPLAGDEMYGGQMIISRQALHCYWMKFYSPFKQKYIEVKAPLPTDISTLIEKI